MPEINKYPEHQLLDLLPTLIFVVDQTGEIKYFNPYAADYIGASNPIPDNINRLSESFNACSFLNAAKKLEQDDTPIYEQHIALDSSEEKRNALLKMKILPNKSRCYLITITDIHCCSFNSRKLLPACNDLRQTACLSAMNEITSIMADQLNQPLTAILTYTQAMQRIYLNNSADVELEQAMSRVVINAKQAGQVIRHIRSQVNPNSLNPEAFSFIALIHQTIQLTELDNPCSCIDLVTCFDLSIDDIYADKMQLQQVLFNLLQNAIDAVLIAVDNQPFIKLSLTKTNEWYKLSIEDNGPGISHEMKKNLFHPFTTTKDNRIGLGLASSQHIIDLHQGKITISSNADTQEQRGTTVNLFLPVQPVLKTKTLGEAIV